jgi:hypothetical protein
MGNYHSPLPRRMSDVGIISVPLTQGICLDTRDWVLYIYIKKNEFIYSIIDLKKKRTESFEERDENA